MITKVTGPSGPPPDDAIPIANQMRARLLELIEEFRNDPASVDTLRNMQSTILGLDSLSRSGGR